MLSVTMYIRYNKLCPSMKCHFPSTQHEHEVTCVTMRLLYANSSKNIPVIIKHHM